MKYIDRGVESPCGSADNGWKKDHYPPDVSFIAKQWHGTNREHSTKGDQGSASMEDRTMAAVSARYEKGKESVHHLQC